MIEIGPNLRDLLVGAVCVVSLAWVMVTAFKRM